MGRGRAKAKQTKVARQLKYSNHHLDVERLREELGSDEPREDRSATTPAHEPESEPAQ